MQKSMKTSIQIFADFPDHRVTGRCVYSISDLLTISLLTYLCGGEDYVDMSEFAHVRARGFGLLSGNDTSPSPDSLRRSGMRPNDGKTVRGNHRFRLESKRSSKHYIWIPYSYN